MNTIHVYQLYVTCYYRHNVCCSYACTHKTEQLTSWTLINDDCEYDEYTVHWSWMLYQAQCDRNRGIFFWCIKLLSVTFIHPDCTLTEGMTYQCRKKGMFGVLHHPLARNFGDPQSVGAENFVFRGSGRPGQLRPPKIQAEVSNCMT